MLCYCLTTTCRQKPVCLCMRLQVLTLQAMTVLLLCFLSTAAYMPVVHVSRVGGVVRTHGLQLHLLRYNANVRATLG